MTMSPTSAPSDIRDFTDTALTRRYFAKISRLMPMLREVFVREMSGCLQDWEHAAMLDQLDRLANTWTALGLKYHMTGLCDRHIAIALQVDAVDSGFPFFREIIQMGQDLESAEERLAGLRAPEALRELMVDHILRQRAAPRDLQFEMSRRLYFEALSERPLFLHRNGPHFARAGTVKRPDGSPARAVAVTWSVFDSARNLPMVYMMVAEDSGRTSLIEDRAALDALGQHLISQSMSTLKMVTIASGLDKDFETLHPKSLKRISVGPLYSNTFTEHNDAIQRILDHLSGVPERDWVLAWTVETILSKSSRSVKTGLFGERQEEIWHVDHHTTEASEAGSSTVRKHMLLPIEAFQALQEDQSSPLHGVTKWVVAPDGRILPNL